MGHAKRVDFDIFLFINTKSGGRAGVRFMELQVLTPHTQMDTVKFRLEGKHIDVSFFNLNESASKDEGIRKLRQSVDSGEDCRCIVCGGDGTVLWVVKEMADSGIDVHRVPVGIIPIGTGNDFSRAMGWGGKQETLIGDKFEKLKSLILEWIAAEVVNFDVWEIELTTHEVPARSLRTAASRRSRTGRRSPWRATTSGSPSPTTAASASTPASASASTSTAARPGP